MSLILSGGGSSEKSFLSYKKFAEELKGGSVLFVPFANDEMSYDEALEWFKNEVKDFGITQIYMIEKPEELSLEFLRGFSGVYFSGGNAFQLLSVLKSCNAFQIVKEFMKKDIVIMGSSAGTTIFGKSADTCLRNELKIVASDKNNVGLKDTDGLNAVGGFSFLVHYKLLERQYADTEKRVQELLKDGHKLICLPEETSLYVNNGKISIIGDLPAEVVFCNSRKVLYQNEDVEFIDKKEGHYERV